MAKHGLGRLYVKDKRDADYPMRSLLPRASGRSYRYWNTSGWWGNQGSKPQCVGYSWAHWLEDGPVTHRGPAPIVAPSKIYNEAQLIDEWPGEGYAGTSVRAGAKVLQGQSLIGGYYWARDAMDVVQALLDLGPVVVGTNWYDSMFDADDDGFLGISGSRAGGHAYVLDGVNTIKGFVRVKNSWGRRWGRNGFAQIWFHDLERLIREQGEACIATERKSGSRT